MSPTESLYYGNISKITSFPRVTLGHCVLIVCLLFTKWIQRPFKLIKIMFVFLSLYVGVRTDLTKNSCKFSTTRHFEKKKPGCRFVVCSRVFGL